MKIKFGKMRKIKVSYMGKYLKDIYPHATRFQVMRYKFNKVMEKVVLVAFVVGLIYGGFKTGQMTTQADMSKAFVAQKVVEVKVKAPVMDRIAYCESGGQHIEKKTGQVVMRSNTNKSVDVGKYQINSVWFKKATELGLDITKEEDNEKFAYWLYENRGTQDWKYSTDCWNK